MSAFVTGPSMASSPGFSHPSTESVGVLSVPRTSPVAAAPAPREFLLLNAADTNQVLPGLIISGDGPFQWNAVGHQLLDFCH